MATVDGLLSNGSISDKLILGSIILDGVLYKVKPLIANVHNGSSQIYSTPKLWGASSGYQVPAGYKYIVVAVRLVVSGGGSGNYASLLSATSDVGFDSASAPTGIDSTSITNTPGNLYSTQAANDEQTIPILMVIPAGKFLCAALDQSSTAWNFADFMIFGFEVPLSATSV